MSKKSGLSKAAKGVAFGDVSNSSVRNILTEISKTLYGSFTNEQMEETMDKYFNWCCPYTGRYLKDDYDNKTGNYATDHIYPQNRIWCGLNVMGNLVLVDKRANSKKGDQSVDEFLLYDTEALGCLDDATRQARLQKIKDFQKDEGYDPNKIQSAISKLLQAKYDKVREDQITSINDALSALNAVGICPTVSPVAKGSKKTSGAKKTREVDEFKKYLVDDCGRSQTTANSYKTNRDKIMGELNITDINELESRIDEAIDYCTKKKEAAKKIGDSRSEKNYNDCRSALKKYKDFMKSKKAKLDE